MIRRHSHLKFPAENFKVLHTFSGEVFFAILGLIVVIRRILLNDILPYRTTLVEVQNLVSKFMFFFYQRNCFVATWNFLFRKIFFELWEKKKIFLLELF